MTTNHSHFNRSMFRQGGPVFTCRVCHKQTRDTGEDEEALRLCKRCLFEAYVENAESDYGVDSQEAQNARERLASLGVKKDLHQKQKRDTMKTAAQDEVTQTQDRSMTMNDTTKPAEATTETKKARKPRKDKGVKKGPKAGAKPAPKKQPKTSAKPKKAPRVKSGKGSIILPEYRKNYTAHVLQDENGKKSRTVDNGDAVSNKLRGEPLDRLYSICRDACDIPRAELEALYSKLNAGQQAMNLRNRIRAAVAAGYKL